MTGERLLLENQSSQQEAEEGKDGVGGGGGGREKGVRASAPETASSTIWYDVIEQE